MNVIRLLLPNLKRVGIIAQWLGAGTINRLSHTSLIERF